MRSEQGRHNFEIQDDYPEREIHALTQEISDIKGQLAAEIEKRRQFEKTLSNHLKFDRLLSEFSSRLVSIPLHQADKELEHALKRINKFFGGDLRALLEVLPDKTAWKITHFVATDDIPSIPVGMELQSSICPWSFNKVIQKREPFSFSRLDDLPFEASVDKQTFLSWGIRSMLEVPIIPGDSVDRLIVVNSVRKECAWDEELVPKLQILGEIFANALKRKQSELELGESAERLSLATESANMGMWVMNVETGLLRVSEKMRELFQFPPEEVLGFERLVEVIYPGDRAMFREHIDQSVRERQFFRVEYRIGKPDGDIRWIVTRGRPCRNAKGSSLHLMGVSMDITENKLVGLQLEKSQTLLDALINSTPDLIWSVDAERFGLIIFNRSLYEYFLHGIGLHIQVGMNPDDLLPTQEYARKWHAFYRRALEEGSFTTEYQVYAGNRTLRLNFNILKRDDTVLGVSVFGQDITGLKGMEEQLRWQLEEIETLKQQTEKENVYLRQEIKTGRGFGNIIGDSVALKYVLFRSQQVAPTDATVLILGETGTGKGMVAYAVHEMSPRKDKPMVTINCAALPENLIESELFGREKGAFTGAHLRQVGRFEAANGGTIFLDEIGEMPLTLQTKLLRVLQDGEFERLGSNRTIKVDVRVIAATSRDLKVEVQNGRFREDLFYRLNVFPVSIPPLRMRSEDIPQLVHHFIGKYARKCGKNIKTISMSTMQILQNYEWPGNVRELEHIIERAVIISQGSALELTDYLDLEAGDKPEESLKDLEAMEREHILKVLQKTHWKIDGEGGAAGILGLNPSTLRFRIKKLDITRP